MKYLFIPFALTLIACGPSAKERLKAEEKRIQDSIEIATRNADSIAALEEFITPSENYDNTISNYQIEDQKILYNENLNNINSYLEYENETYEDGTYSATVDYYNPETGFTNTYTLDVEVENGEVVQINFPRGGWLDNSHINSEALDEDGRATITDDEGRQFEIEIDPQ